MKKILISAIVLTLLLTGCTSPKATNPNSENPKKNSIELFEPQELVKGTKVSDMFSIVEFESGDLGSNSVMYKLAGNDFVNGTLTYIQDKLLLKLNENIATKDVKVKDKNSETGYTVVGFNLPIIMVDINKLNAPPDFIYYVKKGYDITGQFLINELFYKKTLTEQSNYAVVTEVKLDDSDVNKIVKKVNELLIADNQESGKLTQYDNETLYNVDEEVNINYSENSFVVLPMKETINEDKLKCEEITLTNTGNEMDLHFYILGSLDDVTITYEENPLVEEVKPVVFNINRSFMNTKVVIKAVLPSDFSHVIVEGKYYYSELIDGNIHVKSKDIKFSLDSCRDPSSYPLIIIK